MSIDSQATRGGPDAAGPPAAPAEVIVEEAGEFLKLNLLRKAPFSGSIGHRLKENLQRKGKLRQLRYGRDASPHSSISIW